MPTRLSLPLALGSPAAPHRVPHATSLSHRAHLQFNQASGAYAFKATIDQIDLQQLLTQAGTSVNLGALNLQLSNITQSFATVDVPELDIDQGITYQASLAFIGLRADIGFKLDTTGADIVAVLDTSAFSRVRLARSLEGQNSGVPLQRVPSLGGAVGRCQRRAGHTVAWLDPTRAPHGAGPNRASATSRRCAPLSPLQRPPPPHTHTCVCALPRLQAFNDEVLGRLDSALQSVGGSLSDAAGSVQQGRDAALARLAAANATLNQAREALRVAKAAFDAAKAKVRRAPTHARPEPGERRRGATCPANVGVNALPL